MLRAVVVVPVLLLALAAPARAHPFGTPPLAEIVVAGTNARTTLTLALDDTLILLSQAGVDPQTARDADVSELMRSPQVAGYITSRYAISSATGACTAVVVDAFHFGAGVRTFIDHTCPGAIGTSVHVRSELLRDVSEQYRLVAVARVGARQGTVVLEPGDTEATIEVERLRPLATPPGNVDEASTTEGLARLFAFLDEGAGWGAAAAALAVAAALGALHALTPGHGKTLVAAYLAGSEAKVRHAFAVGGVLTITHTGAVVVLGVLALAAGNAFVPQRVEPVLRAVAAAVVLVLGVWLFAKRVAVLRRGGSPLAHEHAHAASRAVSGRGVVAVGMAGGLVPCPEAFGLLFVALSLGKVLPGLLLLLSFSAGLGVVLVAVSIGLVLSRAAVAPRLERSRALRYLPVASALVVVGIGVALGLSAIRAA